MTTDGVDVAPPPAPRAEDGSAAERPRGPSPVPEALLRAVRSPALPIVALALAASATSLWSGFAFDDVPIVLENARVHTLAGWWRIFAESYWPPAYGSDMYRPLAILAFASQWAIGGGEPWVFHLTSVVLYAAVSLVFYHAALALVPRSAAWAAAALFAVHPVHVEAVGNVVGQSELIVALCALLSLTLYLRWRSGLARAPTALPGICLCYALGLLAKENGILLPALLLAAEATVVGDRRPALARARSVAPLFLAMAVIAGGYLVVRALVTGRLGSNDPQFALAGMAAGERALTMLGATPALARLLVWPARLSAFYTPPEIAMMRGWDWRLLPGVAILVGVVALPAAVGRRNRSVPFGLVWFALTLLPVSNLLFPSGVVIAERTLFLPSVGVVLAAAAGIAWLIERWPAMRPSLRLAAGVVSAGVLAAGTWRSAERQRAWRDDEALFAQSVLDAPRSYEAHHMYGRLLFRTGRRVEAERELQRALALFPADHRIHFSLASAYREAGVCAPAIPLYRQALFLAPERPDYRIGLIACLLREADFEGARAESRIGLAGAVERPAFQRLLQIADSVTAARRPLAAPAEVEARPARSGRLHDSVQNTTLGLAARPSARRLKSLQDNNVY